MDNNEKTVTLRCDCNCSMLVIDKYAFHDGEIYYNVSIQGSRYDWKLNTLWGRVKRACKTIFGKPIYYNDIQIMDVQKFKDFVNQLSEMIKDTMPLVNSDDEVASATDSET